MYVYSNIEGRFRNHCCTPETSIYYILSVYVCSLRYPAREKREPCYVVICGLPSSTIFFRIISQTGGKKLLNTKCVLWFCLLLLSETFLITRITQRDIINEHRCSCRAPLHLSNFNETPFFYTNFLKTLKFKFSRKPAQLEKSCSMQTDRWTWRSQQSLFAVLRTHQKTKNTIQKHPVYVIMPFTRTHFIITITITIIIIIIIIIMIIIFT